MIAPQTPQDISPEITPQLTAEEAPPDNRLIALPSTFYLHCHVKVGNIHKVVEAVPAVFLDEELSAEDIANLQLDEIVPVLPRDDADTWPPGMRPGNMMPFEREMAHRLGFTPYDNGIHQYLSMPKLVEVLQQAPAGIENFFERPYYQVVFDRNDGRNRPVSFICNATSYREGNTWGEAQSTCNARLTNIITYREHLRRVHLKTYRASMPQWIKYMENRLAGQYSTLIGTMARKSSQENIAEIKRAFPSRRRVNNPTNEQGAPQVRPMKDSVPALVPNGKTMKRKRNTDDENDEKNVELDTNATSAKGPARKGKMFFLEELESEDEASTLRGGPSGGLNRADTQQAKS